MSQRREQLIESIQHLPVSFWLLIVLFLSFFLKITYWRLDPTVSRDGCLYIRLVQSWHDTGMFPDMISENTPNWIPPFPLFLIKSLMNFGISAEIAGFALNIFLGTFTPLLSYGIAWEITQRKDIGICSALLTAVHPSMNILSVAVQRDMVYLFFIGLCLWLVSAGIRRKQWQFWLGAGIICGCAMLTRFETVEFIVIIPIILFALCLKKHITWTYAFCYACFFLVFLGGTIFGLSFLMKTHEHLLTNYSKYYQIKQQMIHYHVPQTEVFEK